MTSRTVAPVVLVPLLLLGCGGADPAEGQRPGTSQTSRSGESTAESSSPTAGSATPAPAAGTVITTGGSNYGTMLFDRRRQAIYLFDKETGSRPGCYGDCADAWPPVLTDGEPKAAGRARPGLLGTVQRRDGSTQVTYAGHPLYFYAHEGPGQVLCHDIEEYGGLWLVVTPSGEPAP